MSKGSPEKEFCEEGAHRVENLSVGLDQLHVHGVEWAGELEGVRVLSVFLLVQSRPSRLCLLHLQGADRNPTDSLDAVLVILFVLVLENHKKKRF